MSDEKRKALVIAISDYDNLPPRKQLPFCKNDAQTLCEVLEKQGYEIPIERKLIGKVKYETMRAAIREFFREGVKPKDTLLFYFSGHGYLDPPDHYLVTSDMDFKKPDDRGYLFEDLTRLMNRSPSERVVSILDCCHSGGLDLEEGKGLEEVEEEAAKESKQAMSKVVNQEIRQAQGKCILASSLGLQKSFKMPGSLEYSAFSYFVIEGLNGGNGSSVNAKGYVTPESLASYVNDKLLNLPEAKKQTPIRKIEIVGELVLAYHPELIKLGPDLVLLLKAGEIQSFNKKRRELGDTPLDFRNIDLERAKLERVNLKKVNLSHSRLKQANLEGANLEGANLEGANLEGANLEGANLTRAILTRANLKDAKLGIGERFPSSGHFGKSTYMEERQIPTSLQEAQLEEANLEGATMVLANLYKVYLNKAVLYRANLTGADLRMADLSSANMKEAILARGDLRSARLDGADLSEADLSEANLSYASLIGVNLKEAFLLKADLKKAKVDLKKAKSEGAILDGVIL